MLWSTILWHCNCGSANGLHGLSHAGESHATKADFQQVVKAQVFLQRRPVRELPQRNGFFRPARIRADR